MCDLRVKLLLKTHIPRFISYFGKIKVTIHILFLFLKTCMKPLVKKCDEHKTSSGYGAPPPEPKVVCKTWFESVCNTTFAPRYFSSVQKVFIVNPHIKKVI